MPVGLLVGVVLGVREEEGVALTELVREALVVAVTLGVGVAVGVGVG